MKINNNEVQIENYEIFVKLLKNIPAVFSQKNAKLLSTTIYYSEKYLKNRYKNFYDLYFRGTNYNVEQLSNIQEELSKIIDLCLVSKNYKLAEEYLTVLSDLYIDANLTSIFIKNQYQDINSNQTTNFEKVKAHLSLGIIYRTLFQENINIENHSRKEYTKRSVEHYNITYFLQQGELDNDAHVVEQGEIGITIGEKIGTHNIQQCIILIAYNAATKKTILAHFDISSSANFIMKVIIKNFQEQPIDIYLLGGACRSNEPLSKDSKIPLTKKDISDHNINLMLKALFKHKHLNFNIKLADIGNKGAPEAIIFDPQTEELYYKVPNKMSNSLIKRRTKLLVSKINKDGIMNIVNFDNEQNIIFNEIEKLEIENMSQHLLKTWSENTEELDFISYQLYPLLLTHCELNTGAKKHVNNNELVIYNISPLREKAILIN